MMNYILTPIKLHTNEKHLNPTIENDLAAVPNAINIQCHDLEHTFKNLSFKKSSRPLWYIYFFDVLKDCFPAWLLRCNLLKIFQEKKGIYSNPRDICFHH